MRVLHLTIAVAACLMMTINVNGQSIGAGTGILDLENPNNQVDTSSDGTTDQSRINIDDFFTATLGAGEYEVPDWSFRAGQTGSVIPFLAIETEADVYQLLSSGDQVDVGDGDLDADLLVSYGGGNFTLDSETIVFAGIINPPAEGMQNPVYTNLASGATVDHDNNNNGGVQSAIDTGMASNFGHGNLARSYAFAINVNPVPEPTSSLMVFTMAGLLLVKLRRRR